MVASARVELRAMVAEALREAFRSPRKTSSAASAHLASRDWGRSSADPQRPVVLVEISKKSAALELFGWW